MIRLEFPSTKYKSTYLRAVKEFLKKGSDNESTDHYLKHKDLESHFDKFVQELTDHNNGHIKEGLVPSTEFWIIDENGKYCGRISLRHTLNEYLRNFGGHIGYDIIPSERGHNYATNALELCLKEAKKVGLNEVLVTCDDDNIPSIKTIEKNGGILQDKVKNDGVLTRRYHIRLIP
jgi:predicted acetyltransferase